MKLLLVTAALLASHANAEFTPHFNDFLRERFSEKVRIKLERIDLGLGPFGSFGGKESEKTVIKNRPLVFVHGVTLRAMAFVAHRDFFLQRGYQMCEMYATSYGDGGITMAMDTPIHCEYVRQIRRLLIAVHEYTRKKIDVIAWSMGSIISRKAILGGNCTETGQHLGRPLTNIIDTFIATGGPNYGMQRCPKKKKACNPLNSMRCDSALMKELNGQPKRFEGTNAYSIYSFDDTVIGRVCCGHICGELRNGNASIEKPNLNHLTIFSETLPIQYKLIHH